MPTRPLRFRPVIATIAVLTSLLSARSFAEEAEKGAPTAPEKKEPAPKEGDAKDDDTEAKRPVPGPDLKPEEVVRIVMDALKSNDDQDSGIAITFDFASPANQEVTGPLERFIPMVKSPTYAPMLKHKSAKYGKLQTRGNIAQQLVTVIDAEDKEAAYVFRLSKQDEGERKGCWLTDG